MMHDRNERRQREIMAAKNTQVYLSGITEPQHILDKLESRIGKVRLLITSEDSGEAIIEHNTLTGTPNNIRRTRVIVFKGGKNYSVAIDHGGNESANQINETDWKEYIKPIIDIYIEKMESLFCRDQHSNLESIQQKEAKEGVRILSLNKNYDIFLSRVIESIDPQLNTDANYIQDCIRAIDICRLITLQHSQSITKKAPHIPQLDNANILQEIDTILDGRITRRVLRMVTRMLLSRDETMNGLGYPSGLSKDKIHTLSKVLSIIRAYESMCLDMTTESAILMMTH